MTKGKKWTLRLLGVAVLALLICLCFLGSTMARYTSTGDGSGSLTVALWDLEATPAEVEGESVSPSELPYYAEPDGDTAQERSNTSAYIESFTVVNNSEVDAEVSVTLDEEKGVEVGWQTGFTWQNGLTGNQANDYGLGIIAKMGLGSGDNESADTAAFEAIVNGFGVFSIALAFEIGVDDLSNYTGKYITQTNTTTSNTVYLVPLEEGDTFTIEAKGEEDFYAEVIWTSIMEPATDAENLATLLGLVPSAYYTETATGTPATDVGLIDWESFSDDVDTILGMYAEKLTFNVVWKAVQASTLPTDTTITEP